MNQLGEKFARGNTLDEGVQRVRGLEMAGVDALHVSTGSQFPHPRNPSGLFPAEDAALAYPALIPSGKLAFWNYQNQGRSPVRSATNAWLMGW